MPAIVQDLKVCVLVVLALVYWLHHEMEERRSVQKDIAEIRMTLKTEFLIVHEDLEPLKSDVTYFRTVMSKLWRRGDLYKRTLLK